jgi:DNA-binding CsgD family transcriptional regulator/PAS domain-containing protein
MDRTKTLLETIANIYTAPGNGESGWSTAVAEATALVGGKAGVYLRINMEDMTTEGSGFCGFTAEDLISYQGAQAAKKDIRLSYLHNLVPGQAFREFEFVTDREAYDRSEWIRHQVERHGVYWCLSAHVSRERVWNDYLSINGLKARGPFSDAEKSDMQAVLPHFARAAELDRLVNRLENRFGAVLSVLDHFLVGLVILDTRGRVIVHNAAAREAAENSAAISFAGGRMELTSRGPNQNFQALVAQTLSTIMNQGQSDGGQQVVPKRSGTGCLLVETMPIRDDGFSDGDHIRGCAVFVIDPAQSQVISLAGVASIFGLTEAEREVAGSLVNGHDLRRISEERGVSLETARSQLKAVFRKTGAPSQNDLIRLAVKATPPIRGNTPDQGQD